MPIGDIEKESGRKFTEEQKAQLQIQAWVKANEALVRYLMKNPKKADLCYQVCDLK